MQVILFNFLIAIVTESYKKVMSSRKINNFGNKAELNHEFGLAYNFFQQYIYKIETDFDILFIMSPDEDINEGDTAWIEFFNRFRHFLYIQSERDKEEIIDYVDSRIASLERMIELHAKKIDKDIEKSN